MSEAPAPSLLGVVERLLAAAALAGATIYVLLNALYLEFLDDFGLRPEDVGIDRLAVLGRAAWVALVGLGVAAVAVALAMFLSTLRSRALDALVLRRFCAAGILVVTGALAIGFLAVRAEVERSADAAKTGTRVGGLGWIIEFVDIRAIPSRVTWVSDRPRPDLVTQDDYLYLGRGDNLIALLSCDGVTIMLSPDDVVVEILDYDTDDPAPRSIC